MIIKDPNTLFKDNGKYSRYIYCFIDGPQLDALENWLNKYPDSKINNLEVLPHVSVNIINGIYDESLDSKVILDVYISNKYVDDGVSSPEDY